MGCLGVAALAAAHTVVTQVVAVPMEVAAVVPVPLGVGERLLLESLMRSELLLTDAHGAPLCAAGIVPAWALIGACIPAVLVVVIVLVVAVVLVCVGSLSGVEVEHLLAPSEQTASRCNWALISSSKAPSSMFE